MNQKTIKKYSSLKYAKYRKQHGIFLAEGRHIVDALLSSDYEIETIITSDAGIEGFKTPDNIMYVERLLTIVEGDRA